MFLKLTHSYYYSNSTIFELQADIVLKFTLMEKLPYFRVNVLIFRHDLLGVVNSVLMKHGTIANPERTCSRNMGIVYRVA